MLVDLTTAKNYIGITGDEFDTQLEFFSEFAQSEVENYLNINNLEQSSYIEVVEFEQKSKDIDPREGLALRNNPKVISLNNYPVLESGFQINYTNDIQTNVVDTDKYRVDYKLGLIYFYNYQTDYKRGLRVEYTAGYTNSTLPKMIEYIILEGIRFMYKNYTKTGAGTGQLKSESVKNYSVSFNNTNNTESDVSQYIQNHAKSINRFKRFL